MDVQNYGLYNRETYKVFIFFFAQMDQFELLFYNASIVILPAVGLAFFTGDIKEAYNYTEWYNHGFLLSFILACIMGYVSAHARLTSKPGSVGA